MLFSMKNPRLVMAGMLFLISCQSPSHSSKEPSLTAEQEQITSYFNELEKLLSGVGKEFWGKDLYGPLMVIDPQSRVFYANENNEAGSFEPIGSIYTDTLPHSLNIANTAFEWEGKRWTMVMSPLPESAVARNTHLAHELFHRIQPEVGFTSFVEKDNAHLDSKMGRLYLRLECEALIQALSSKDFQEAGTHLQRAWVFRKIRHTDEETAAAENSIELNEGICEYTGVMLGGRTKEALKPYFIDRLTAFQKSPSYLRTFAYECIPVYGYFLFQQDPQWHRKIDRESNLTEFFQQQFSFKLPEDLAAYTMQYRGSYGYEDILVQEEAREEEILAKIEGYKTLFLGESSLALPLENMNLSFDYRDIMPLEAYGTVYPSIRITDNWGILSAQKGALISPEWNQVTVSAPIEFTDSLVIGEGWTLELHAGHTLLKEGQKYILQR